MARGSRRVNLAGMSPAEKKEFWKRRQARRSASAGFRIDKPSPPVHHTDDRHLARLKRVGLA